MDCTHILKEISSYGLYCFESCFAFHIIPIMPFLNLNFIILSDSMYYKASLILFCKEYLDIKTTLKSNLVVDGDSSNISLPYFPII